MTRAYYFSGVSSFIQESDDSIIGKITQKHSQDIVNQQTFAWTEQIRILKQQLVNFSDAYVAFEVLIPRMGRRADVVVLHKGIIFVLEFKVGSNLFNSADQEQTYSYCLDFQSFHEGSDNKLIVPILVATRAKEVYKNELNFDRNIASIQRTNGCSIENIIKNFTGKNPNYSSINFNIWINSSYKPTPTIIEAARALYANHNVADIMRHDATAKNLTETTTAIKDVISYCHRNKKKAICFVTGVPGAGKTLVGLNVATQPTTDKLESAVYLSGNGPLVNVLREALIQDRVVRGERRVLVTPEVKASIQNVHHFRDQYSLVETVPHEHVVIFDEAQRAWTEKHLVRNKPEYSGLGSEPDLLLSSMDRHGDWCVVVALVGTGQEINTGEAGISSWTDSINTNFQEWDVYYSNALDRNYFNTEDSRYYQKSGFHLPSSQRSYRASNLSNFIDAILKGDAQLAKEDHRKISDKYPIRITRSLVDAKNWIKKQCRGLERMGMLSSSSGRRLRAEGILNSKETDEAHWFLKPSQDVRSSNMLEEAMSEFKVQGLELDWSLIGWDADFRYVEGCFEYYKFSGTKWQNRGSDDSKRYLENTYRVLLTRARQGFIIYIPLGDKGDFTRLPEFYDSTYKYLKDCGIEELK